MCGINGVYNYQNLSLENPRQVISLMNHEIAHRGPDDEGYWQNASDVVHLGHRRLSILDLSQAGHQPMQLKDHHNCLVFNGEIYNYKELIQQNGFDNLESSTDTEVLYRLLKNHPQKALGQLNGMFAFAFWDDLEQTLLIARDRAGQKPVYYTQQAGFFAFSSELKALLALPWIKKELDEESFYDFLTYNKLHGSQTMFKGINKLPPAHTLEINKKGELKISQFWEANNQIENRSEEETIDIIYSLLEDAVRLRMRSDVPVGAFLSGGVDSSAVVGFMNQYTQKAVSTFSIGFKGQSGYDERNYAQRVSKLYNTNHFEKEVEAQDFKDFLPKMVDIFDAPLADTTCVPIYFLSELAKKEGVKVVLTGDGADELWGGYRNWQNYLKWNPYFNLYKNLPNQIKKLTSKAYAKNHEGSAILELLQRAEAGQDLFWSGANGFKENSKKNFLSKNFLEKQIDLNSYQRVETIKQDYQNWLSSNHTDFLHYLSFTGIKDPIPNLFLYRLDKLSMAHSIEGRTPFLDYRLINLALETPSNLKMYKGEPKYILKKSLEKMLPKDVLYRKKMGFCVPIQEWGSEIMMEDLNLNLKGFCEDYNLFEYEKVSQMLRRVEKEESTYINRVWTFYFLMNWFKKWLN